jgi:tetratricopeptide (TPR) repeat protein
VCLPAPRPGRYKCPRCGELLRAQRPRRQLHLLAPVSAAVGGVFTIVAAGLLMTQAPRFAERVAAETGVAGTPIPNVGYPGALYPERPGYESLEARSYLRRAAQLEHDLRLDKDDFDIATRIVNACLAVAERDFIVGSKAARHALHMAERALAAARRGADPETDGPYLAMLESRWRLMANPDNIVRARGEGYGGYYGPGPWMGRGPLWEGREELARLQARAAANPKSARNWRRLGWAYVALARTSAGAREQPFDLDPPLRTPAARQALAAAEAAMREARDRARSKEGRRLAYSALARIYRYEGRNDAERDVLERAVQLRPNLRRDWERLADVCGRERDFPAARRALAAADQCEPGTF